MIKFNVTPDETALIASIAERAIALFKDAGIKQTQMDTCMDLSACIANGCPLKLSELLAADDFNFMHDVAGVRRHLNRTTGLLEDCFLPRFAKRGE